MPPNLFVKTAIVRGDLAELEKNSSGNNEVRTDFILQNIFSYLVKDHHTLTPMSAINKRENDVLVGMKETIDAFRSGYADAVKTLCADIDEISERSIHNVLSGVANEIFSEGIGWSRVIAFFVFVGEIAITCVSRNMPSSALDIVYDCFSSYVKEKLEMWINDHESWEGVASLCYVTEQKTSVQDPGWARSVLYGVVRIVGTLAQIVNTTNDAVP